LHRYRMPANVNKMKTNKMTKFVLVLVVLLVVIRVVQAQVTTKLVTSQEVYAPEDTILVTAEIFNPDNYKVDVILESSLASEDGTYPVAIIPHFITLNASEKKIITLYNFEVNPEISEGMYSASFRVIRENDAISSGYLTFQIINTLKEISADFKTCKDQHCSQESNIFILNENIYLDYISNIEGISVAGTLTSPNGAKHEITIPTSIKAEQIGTYELGINASKSGYKTITEKVQFGVIDKEADIGYTSLSQIKSIEEQVKKTKLSYVLLMAIIGIILFLAAVLLFVIFLKNRKEREKKSKKKEFLNEILK